MTKKNKIDSDKSTEEKIKDAARKIFTQKGFAATRTRDIAEEAGLNLALLNYYFRSKEKLFELIMMEKVQKLFGVIVPTLNDTSTTLDRKIEIIVHNYIEMLGDNPDLPLFVLSEIRNNPEQFGTKMQAAKVMRESHFVRQLHELRPDVNPLHFLMSIFGMILFPFIGRPIFMSVGVLGQKEFEMAMQERKMLVPKWVSAILKTR